MHPLEICIEPAVRLRIIEIQDAGGITDADIKMANGFAQVLGEKGDILLFKSKKEGEAASIFNQLAKALAILAFVPGGVTFCGVHYESKPNAIV